VSGYLRRDRAGGVAAAWDGDLGQHGQRLVTVGNFG
jgi:hypothetical protein